MDSKLIFELIFINHIFLFTPIFSMNNNRFVNKSWFVGRTPPSKFEYSELNGFYSPKEARQICEKDFQCGGFTFKGVKESLGKKEIYFFRFVPNDQRSLGDYLKYPHWSTYIVSSRDYVIVFGSHRSNVSNMSYPYGSIKYM